MSTVKVQVQRYVIWLCPWNVIPHQEQRPQCQHHSCSSTGKYFIFLFPFKLRQIDIFRGVIWIALRGSLEVNRTKSGAVSCLWKVGHIHWWIINISNYHRRMDTKGLRVPISTSVLCLHLNNSWGVQTLVSGTRVYRWLVNPDLMFWGDGSVSKITAT